mmetsp:Transcript_21379/g.49734  ORF Transcript_21379/g.49734 Transcript_21379/m.49734 type:complete len:131 (-) Transcript_21379:14-406(-)|eukprot:CAMPEP_0178442712 /NCGR_PEP_ID=MMETSP0689_2-20121128/38364_1 /TAXON_ID=160604 /ORGANISM="Amphidinium massartii, Strain CS-259" /LENGTH=130 /DNA_ID=CAMNT_0020066383 /DNA_START=58 /DNA_END=450 /DNA_ORIENTATION=-
MANLQVALQTYGLPQGSSPIPEAEAPPDLEAAARQGAPRAKPRNTARTYKMLKGTNAIMLMGLPRSYTNDDLRAELDTRGMEGKYDYIYVPCDDRGRGNKGFGFVNLLTAEDARVVADMWDKRHAQLKRR